MYICFTFIFLSQKKKKRKKRKEEKIRPKSWVFVKIKKKPNFEATASLKKHSTITQIYKKIFTEKKIKENSNGLTIDFKLTTIQLGM